MLARWKRWSALLDEARAVRRETGKGVVAQLREMRRLRTGYGRLLPADYFAYRVFDDAAYPGGRKDDVVSWSYGELARLNNPGWWGVAADKLVTYAMLDAFGLPFPRLIAVFDAGGRAHGRVPALSARAEMEAFLRTLDRPAFGKPVAGSLGEGASSIDGYDPAADELRLAHGGRVGVAAYVERYVLPARYGYVLQERVVPHPEVVALTGPSISTLRLVVLNGRDGPTLFRAMWKIAVGEQITDNYRRGTAGNLKAWVDLADGRVRAAFLGDASAAGGRRRLGEFVERHPATGRALVGEAVPLWEAARSLALGAARHFPGLRYQSWDVALGDGGPTILELNSRGLPQQLPGFPGMGDPALRRFVRQERPAAAAEHDYFARATVAHDILRHPDVERGPPADPPFAPGAAADSVR